MTASADAGKIAAVLSITGDACEGIFVGSLRWVGSAGAFARTLLPFNVPAVRIRSEMSRLAWPADRFSHTLSRLPAGKSLLDLRSSSRRCYPDPVQTRSFHGCDGPGDVKRRLPWGLAVLVLSTVLLLPCNGSAAEPDSRSPVSGLDYVVDFWRTDQGLPNNTVNALLQTRDGYLWVGTANGLARFDGLVFTVLGEEAGPGLADSVITALLEDHEGGLWVGTQERGLVHLSNGHSQRFGKAQGLLDNAVTSLAQDSKGHVWIGTQGGLNVWENGHLEAFTSDTLREGEAISALHAGRSGVLWVTTRFEVYRLQDGRMEPFRFEEMPQVRNADFVGVYEDLGGNLWAYGATFLLNRQGNRYNSFGGALEPASSRVWTICEQGDALWIGTSGGGLSRFQDGRFKIVGTRDGLDQCDVRALYADGSGNLWIGTSASGLARLRTQQWRVLGLGEGLVSTHLTALAADVKGRLVVGSADAGLMVLDGQDVKPLEMGPPLRLATDICSLCTDQTDAFWVGTWGAGLFRVMAEQQWNYTTAEGLSDNVVLAVAADRKQDAVWAGTLSGGLHRVSPTNVFSLTAADGLTGRPIVCLLVASDDNVLAGSQGGGLVCWDGRRLEPVPAPPGLTDTTVSCLMEDQSGRLWAGTIGAGAYCRLGKRWVALGLRQGLVSDVIKQFVQDEAGHYWFNTDKGLCQVYARDMEDFLLGRQVGVATVLSRREDTSGNSREALGWARALRTKEGTLWFITNDGLLTVDPTRTRVIAAPPVMIEKVLVNGEPVLSSTLGSHVEQLRIAPGLRSLDFFFTAVSFTAPQQTQFRHMLEGSDLDWVQSDTSRRAHYGPLAPGRYRFRVIAVNADGIWNETGDSLALVVVPPVWRSWWFLTLSTIAGVAYIWAMVRYVSFRRLRARLRVSEQRRAMEQERARIAQDMHDEIGSKLTRISFLSEAARNAGAELTAVGPQVTSIANTSRELLKALDEIVWAVNPRNDNLEHLAGYLEQYAREYFQGTPVECRITVPDQLPHVSLSAEMRHNVFLAFEEVLSNALRHAQPTRVSVEMKVRPDAFEVIVEDNGKGFLMREKRTPVGHDGLQNMKERLHSMGGACIIRSEPGRGTTVRLRVPQRAAAKAKASKAATL